MDLSEYRSSAREKERIADLMSLVPGDVQTVLDIGARDGFISKLLVERYSSVTALDLEKPEIVHPGIRCVKGDVTALDFPDATFDLIFCAEVLEHIPVDMLTKACLELGRVSNRYIVIGVPYRQDTRVGRTTCGICGRKNPPWGHVNRFDENRLQNLFPEFEMAKQSYVGLAEPGTNFLSSALMDLAGNPFGSYTQDEPCVHCGAALKPPPERNLLQKIFTRLAVYVRTVQAPMVKRRPHWIHVLFERRAH